MGDLEGQAMRADYDQDLWYSTLPTGSLHYLGESRQTAGAVVAVLVVPDPEQRRGWREHYVRAELESPARSPIGFTTSSGRR